MVACSLVDRKPFFLPRTTGDLVLLERISILLCRWREDAIPSSSARDTAGA